MSVSMSQIKAQGSVFRKYLELLKSSTHALLLMATLYEFHNMYIRRQNLSTAKPFTKSPEYHRHFRHRLARMGALFPISFNALVVVEARMLQLNMPPELMKGLRRISDIEMDERWYREDPGLRLLPMVEIARDAKAADIREHIFAILLITNIVGRATEEMNQEIGPPRYQCLRQIFIRKDSYHIRHLARPTQNHSRSLMVLSTPPSTRLRSCTNKVRHKRR